MKSQTIRKYPEYFICWMTLDLVVEALPVLGQRAPQQALFRHPLQADLPSLEALARRVLEVRVDRVVLRHVELGKRILDRLQLQVAHLCDLPGAVERARVPVEQACHLVPRLEVELLGVEAHALRVRQRLARLHAQQGVVGSGVFLGQVVSVVRRNERDPGFLRQTELERDQLPVEIQPVVLDLKEEVVPAENVEVFVREPATRLVSVVQQRFLQIAAQTCGQADQAFGVTGQKILADPGLVVEALEVAGGDEVDEVAVPGLVLAKKDQSGGSAGRCPAGCGRR